MKKLLTSCVIIFSVFLLSACGSLYDDSKGGYTKATSVSGVTFDVPNEYLSDTTVITSITEDNDYEDGTFLYKEEDKGYTLFKMDEIVIICYAGTSFNLRDCESVNNTLQSKGLNKTWFIPIKNKIKYKTSKKDDVFKLVCSVNADVSVTTDLYGIYTGKFASIQKGDLEYSIFAGIPEANSMTSKEKKMINHIVKSFKYAGISETET